MSKNDDGFNLDDMMEIFGDAESLTAPKAQAETTAAPKAVPHVPAAPAQEVSAEELAILAAYEKSKKDQKAKEEEARRKKDDEAKQILERYERELREGHERESKLKKELELRQKQEIEDLKKKETFKVNPEEEERKIIEEFERQAALQKEKDDADRQAKEAKAQQDLKALVEKQKIEEAATQAEAEKSEEAFKAEAAAKMGEKKEGRLLELLAKAQKDLESSAAVAPVEKGSAKDILIDVEQKENDAFILMLDATRKSMFTYLAPKIGIKAATSMLNKTVERARTKAPVVLKDANWRMDGTLREDGSVDPERTLANVQKLSAGTRVEDFLAGLHELVDLRIRAVEAGLGSQVGADMKSKLADCRPFYVEKKIQAEWIDLFYSQVIG
jgi:hypothetical protein